MHKHNIIHRDLKSENILKHNEKYKIADFGMAKIISSLNDISEGTTLGNLMTMAPEVMERHKYGIKVILLIDLGWYLVIGCCFLWNDLRKGALYGPDNRLNGIQHQKPIVKVKWMFQISWEPITENVGSKSRLKDQLEWALQRAHIIQILKINHSGVVSGGCCTWEFEALPWKLLKDGEGKLHDSGIGCTW